MRTSQFHSLHPLCHILYTLFYLNLEIVPKNTNLGGVVVEEGGGFVRQGDFR